MQVATKAGGRQAASVLTVDLAAIRSNYRRLRARLKPQTRCGAVVKADAYGLGAAAVSKALLAEGCETFFVALLDEGLALRPHLPASATIAVLNGLPRGGESECVAAGLLPVLNSLAQIETWSACARQAGHMLPAAVQIDSGMNRLGLMPREVARYRETRERYAGLDLRFVMSHLACADEPEKEASASQRDAFARLTASFPDVPRSLANSSGIFLGAEYHYDLVRPGAALYGINPTPASPNPMRPAVRLTTQVVQLRDIGAGDHVGYGWEFRAPGTMRLATLSIGYADGLHRAFAMRGAVFLDGHRLPVVGRVSMDSLIVDATALPEGSLAPGMEVEIIGSAQPVDDLATAIDTIGYEVLTSLGRRFTRVYRDDAAGPVSSQPAESVSL